MNDHPRNNTTRILDVKRRPRPFLIPTLKKHDKKLARKCDGMSTQRAAEAQDVIEGRIYRRSVGLRRTIGGCAPLVGALAGEAPRLRMQQNGHRAA